MTINCFELFDYDNKFDFIKIMLLSGGSSVVVHGFVFITPQGSDLKIGKKLITTN